MGNLKEQYERLIGRLYHEDTLFAQRISNFIAMHAFLAAALALSVSGTGSSDIKGSLIPYLVTIFGLLLSLFYIPLGLRSCTAILFWRLWLREVESKSGFKLDSALFEFYEKGCTETGVGKIGPVGEEMRSVMQVFPWVLPCVRSTNMWFGVWLPALTAVFWALVLVLAFPEPFRRISLVFVGCILTGIVHLALDRRFLPPTPTLLAAEDKEE